MKYLFTVSLLITFFFLSCKTYQIEKMSSKGASLTAEEIVALSQDCDFVYKMISRGLKDVTTDKERHTTFMRNDFLVSLLKGSHCLNGKTKVQITKLGMFRSKVCEP